MVDLGMVGSIASVVGLIAAAGIALYQRDVALKAQRRAEAERKRAATLEDHLARQRWQQLRSLGEQIDALELDGRHKYEAVGAALHARLREQYSALLGVVATSTPAFSASAIRHWVTIGRLPRPWQIAEAISHLESPMTAGEQSEDEHWLAQLIDSASVVQRPQAVQTPKELNEYVAAFILVADSVREELRELLSRGGQAEYSGAVLLHHLACDCLQIRSLDKIGRPQFKTWGWEGGKPLGERFAYYQGQYFWAMVAAADAAQAELDGFRYLFEPGQDFHSKMLIPYQKAVEIAHAKYPELLRAVVAVFEAREIRPQAQRGNANKS